MGPMGELRPFLPHPWASLGGLHGLEQDPDAPDQKGPEVGALLGVLSGFKVLGFLVLRVLGFRVLGFRVLGFRVLGCRVLGYQGFRYFFFFLGGGGFGARALRLRV